MDPSIPVTNCVGFVIPNSQYFETIDTKTPCLGFADYVPQA